MAASVESKFILDGTVFDVGYHDRKRTRAMVVCSVIGTTDTSGAYEEAVEAAVADVGTTLTYDGKAIPMHSARAKKWGAGKCMVTLIYAYGEGAAPLQDAFSFARERGFGEKRKKTFHVINPETGEVSDAPVGEKFYLIDCATANPDTNEGTLGLFSRNRKRPLAIVSVPTVLDTNPIGEVAEHYGVVNQDDVVINGILRAGGTLKFMGCQVEPVDLRTGLVYVIRYVFHWFPAGWGTYKLIIGNEVDVTLCDQTFLFLPTYYIYHDEHRDVDFANLFPTHDGTGPAPPTSAEPGPSGPIPL